MDAINELLTRGVDKIYPSKEELEKVLRSGKKLKLYQGFDPTSPNLHIGHMVGLRKLRQWQDLGHHVIFLIGDFTGMIGDPSGKDTARNPLTKEQVLKNAQTYRQQASKILRFEGDNPMQLKFNSEWLGKMTASDFLRLARNVTYSQVAERDMFQKRLKKGKDVYINEFLYPIMQAYDSVEMDVDVEVGGSDQTFNMLMGRKLMRNMKQKEKFVMTTPLLTDVRGQKIGKTEGNVISFTDKPIDLFSKIMALPDDIIAKGFEYLTDIPMDNIQQIKEEVKKRKHIISHKKKLAFEIVKQLNDHNAAHKAQENFEKVTQEKNLPPVFEMQNIPIWSRASAPISGATIVEPLIGSGTVSSKSQLKDLVSQGGVSILTNKETGIEEKRVENINEQAPPVGSIIKVGKRKFLKIKL